MDRWIPKVQSDTPYLIDQFGNEIPYPSHTEHSMHKDDWHVHSDEG